MIDKQQTITPLPIEQLREKITHVDNQLLDLLLERKSLAKQVALYKQSKNAPIRDVEREENLLNLLIEKGVKIGLDAHYIMHIFHAIISDSISTQQLLLQQLANEALQGKRSVGFLGNEGTYSFLAAKKFFSSDIDNTHLQGFSSFREIIKQVESESINFGILPIENSTSGSITDTYDLLINSTLAIVGEVNHPIAHCLVAREAYALDEIKVLYTHPEILAQCSQLVDALGCEVVYESSSSSAMQSAKKDLDRPSAALGSLEASKIYGMMIIKENAANSVNNTSRFVVIAKKPLKISPSLTSKTSIVLSVNQKPGSLVNSLLIFRKNNVNITKLESRPIPGNPWQELFYLDIDGTDTDPAVLKTISALNQQSRYVRILGSYPKFIDDKTPIKPENLLAAHHDTTQTQSEPLHSNELPSLLQRHSQTKTTVIQSGSITIGTSQLNTILQVSSCTDLHQLEQQLKGATECGIKLFNYRIDTFTGINDSMQYIKNFSKVSALVKKYNMHIIAQVRNEVELMQMHHQADFILLNKTLLSDPGELLKLTNIQKPILLERGSECSMQEWLLDANAILEGGNLQLVLLDTGVLSRHNSMHALDFSSLSHWVKQTHVPVFVDPRFVDPTTNNIFSIITLSKAIGLSGICLTLRGGSFTGHTEFCVTLDELPQIMQQILDAEYASTMT